MLEDELGVEQLSLVGKIRVSGMGLERPKSQSFIWQSMSTRMLAGFISRCIRLALCRKLMEQRVLYRMVIAWSSVN